MKMPSTPAPVQTVQEWLDRAMRDPGFRHDVEEELNRIRIEQDLARLRELRGVSQAQLAKLLGVSQAVIGRIESGRAQNLGIRTMVRIASALGARVHIAIEADDGVRPQKKAKLALVGRLRKVAKAS